MSSCPISCPAGGAGECMGSDHAGIDDRLARLGQRHDGKGFPAGLVDHLVAPISSSSPCSASISGQMTVRRPRLIEFCRKMRAKCRATTTRSGAFQTGGRLLARRAAAEVLACHDHAAGGISPAFNCLLNSTWSAKAILRRLAGQDSGHETPRVDDVGRYIIAKFQNDFCHISLPCADQ